MKVSMRKYISSDPSIDGKLFYARFSYVYRDKDGMAFGRVEYVQGGMFVGMVKNQSRWFSRGLLFSKEKPGYLFSYFEDSNEMSCII